LPSISTELGASASELQWIVDAYVLVFAALLLTMGSISDRVGRKRSPTVESSIQGAHRAAAHISTPAVAHTVVDTANRAFVSSMTEAMLAAAIIMGFASLVAFVILPAHVIPPREEVEPLISRSGAPSHPAQP
jgi:MFS family permease